MFLVFRKYMCFDIGVMDGGYVVGVSLVFMWGSVFLVYECGRGS